MCRLNGRNHAQLSKPSVCKIDWAYYLGMLDAEADSFSVANAGLLVRIQGQLIGAVSDGVGG